MAIRSKSKLRQDSIIRICNRRRWTKKRTQWTQIRLLAIRLEPCSGNGIFSPWINSMIQGANPPPFDRIRSCPGKYSPISRSKVATSSPSFPHAVKTYIGITKTSVGKISSNDLWGCKPSLFVLYSYKDDTHPKTQCFSYESNTYHLGPTRLAQSRRSPQRISRKKSRQVPR